MWVNESGRAGVNVTFTFRLTFDLAGLDPATAKVTGSWGVDNTAEIFLNGSNAGIGTGTLSLSNPSNFGNWQAFHEFTLNNGFVGGQNTLDFVATDVDNLGALNVTNLVGTAAAAAVPESSSLILLGIGVIGVQGFSWRRRARTGRVSRA